MNYSPDMRDGLYSMFTDRLVRIWRDLSPSFRMESGGFSVDECKEIERKWRVIFWAWGALYRAGPRQWLRGCHNQKPLRKHDKIACKQPLRKQLHPHVGGDGQKDSCAGESALRAKLTSRLESMIEDKFRSMKFAEWGTRTEDWNLWLDANGILKLRCGYDHFNPRNSDLIYISNPAHRFAVAEKDILAVDKEFATKALIFGFLP